MKLNELLDQAGELKAALVEYACSPGFARSLARAMSTLPGRGETEQDRWAEAVESMLYLRGDGGREPLLSRYLRTNKNIDPEARLVYEGWRDRNVLGVFKITGHRGVHLRLHNLIDELDYDAYATVDAEDIQGAVPRGGYVFTRLVPVGDIWTVSGTMRMFAAKDLPSAKTLAARLLKQFPALAYNNPKNLVRAHELAEIQHANFLKLFGAQVVSGTGIEVIAAYRNFLNACNEAAVAEHPEAAARIVPGEQLVPDESFPPEIAESANAALFHHPLSGISILTQYGQVEAAHRTPPDNAHDPNADVLRGYIEDDTIPAYVLEYLAAKYPDTVDAAYRVALSLPKFRWESDGAALLSSHRTDSDLDNGLPGLSPVPPLLMDAYRDLG